MLKYPLKGESRNYLETCRHPLRRALRERAGEAKARMRDDLLSIGEVSKLKGVGVKALRYYERIGILDPAYVHPRTGYRYYALRQMTEIDVIASCVELGIPLKELKEYRSASGVLEVSALLERGHALAEEKLRAAQTTLAVVDDYRTQIALQDSCRRAPEPYRRQLEPGTVLRMRWTCDGFDAKRYTRAMTALYGFAKKSGLAPLFLQGMALLPDGSARGDWFVVLEVGNPTGAGIGGGQEVELAHLAGGTFQGRRIVGGFEESYERAFAAASRIGACGLPVFVLEVWDAEIRTDQCALELLHA